MAVIIRCTARFITRHTNGDIALRAALYAPLREIGIVLQPPNDSSFATIAYYPDPDTESNYRCINLAHGWCKRFVTTRLSKSWTDVTYLLHAPAPTSRPSLPDPFLFSPFPPPLVFSTFVTLDGKLGRDRRDYRDKQGEAVILERSPLPSSIT